MALYEKPEVVPSRRVQIDRRKVATALLTLRFILIPLSTLEYFCTHCGLRNLRYATFWTHSNLFRTVHIYISGFHGRWPHLRHLSPVRFFRFVVRFLNTIAVFCVYCLSIASFVTSNVNWAKSWYSFSCLKFVCLCTKVMSGWMFAPTLLSLSTQLLNILRYMFSSIADTYRLRLGKIYERTNDFKCKQCYICLLAHLIW